MTTNGVVLFMLEAKRSKNVRKGGALPTNDSRGRNRTAEIVVLLLSFPSSTASTAKAQSLTQSVSQPDDENSLESV